MRAKLLGYAYRKEHEDANDKHEYDEEGEFWDLYFGIPKGKYIKLTVSETYGSCYSGWTSASWGDMEHTLVDGFNTQNLTKPIKDIFIEVNKEGNPFYTDKPKKEFYDANTLQLLSTEGEEIAYSTGDGGCNYYPSGKAEINKNLFKS